MNADQNRHSMVTRGRNNFSIPAHKTSLLEKGPAYNCIKVYNALPSTIKRILTLSSFKNELKNYLLDKCFYSVDNFFSS